MKIELKQYVSIIMLGAGVGALFTMAAVLSCYDISALFRRILTGVIVIDYIIACTLWYLAKRKQKASR